MHRHILEDMPPGVDPSLCDKQRQLKRARLADTLSSQLSLRPGPLELIQKNILHTDDPVEQAVKEGQLQFKPTAEGRPDSAKVGLPSKYTVASSFDEDSSSDVAQSPPEVSTSMAASPCPAVTTTSVVKSESTDSIFSTSNVSESGEATSALSTSGLAASPAATVFSDLRQSSSSDSPSAVFAVPSLGGAGTSSVQHQAYSQRSAPGKDQARKKKAKPKAQGKPRTIKFHEYKVSWDEAFKERNRHASRNRILCPRVPPVPRSAPPQILPSQQPMLRHITNCS